MCEVVQLEAVELQEPAEERMDWKSDAPQQVRDKAHSLPLAALGACIGKKGRMVR